MRESTVNVKQDLQARELKKIEWSSCLIPTQSAAASEHLLYCLFFTSCTRRNMGFDHCYRDTSRRIRTGRIHCGIQADTSIVK